VGKWSPGTGRRLPGGCWHSDGGESPAFGFGEKVRTAADIPVPVQLREYSEPSGQLGREERDGLAWRYVPSGKGTRFSALCVCLLVRQ
jgi:hypothetical protein